MHRNEAENMTSGGLFPDSPPYAVITPEFVNAIQEELMNVVENAGLLTLNQGNDTRNQLWTAIQNMVQGYDYIVHNQTTFNALFTRTGANAYDISSDYENVLFKQCTGGYSVSGILSGGDTWGDISTNACKHIEFQNGAYINFGALPGNLTVDTDDCYLKNVNIQGNGSSGAITESFELAAYRVTFDNCKCSGRLSSVDMVGFQGSGTAAHNITSKYVNCSAYDLEVTSASNSKLYGFKDCYNLQNCLTYNLTLPGNDTLYGFSSCTNLNNCIIYALDCTENSSDLYGFFSCINISNCFAYDLDTAGLVSPCYAFSACSQVSSCKADNITSAQQMARGFATCNQISACSATNIAGSTEGDGFYDCDQISSCYATGITGASNYGFSYCNYGAALGTDEAANPNNDWIDTVDAQITNKVSTPSIWT